MKCPLCGKENQSMLCPECGFDSSRDYGKYPTFGPVRNLHPVSALRTECQEKQVLAEPAEPLPDSIPSELEQLVQTKRKLLPLLIAAAFVLTLGLGIWIGAGLGGEEPVLTEPPGTTGEPERPVQMIAEESWTENILRSDVPPTEDIGSNSLHKIREYSVFGSEYRREEIGSVHFLDTLADAPEDVWDVSQAGDGSVLAWVNYDGTLYDLYIGADGGISAPENCNGLFMFYCNAQIIDFGNAFHTENVQDVSDMFRGCTDLSELDLSGFETSNVRDMCGMFRLCSVLSELNISSFDTSEVQDMSYIFSDCYALKKLDLSGFDTSSVQNMSGMFYNCDGFELLDLSGFDTSNVQDMSNMFRSCGALKELKLRNFDTSDVQDMSHMFDYCEALYNMDLSSFDTSNVVNMSYMFNHCGALKKLDLSSFDTSKVQDMSGMFCCCYYLTALKLSERFVSANAETEYMFSHCPAGDNYQHLLH